MVDIAVTSKELKEFVSRFDSTQFLGELSSMMQWINPGSSPDYMKGLSSPQKQFFYLAALNITSPVNPDTDLEGQFSDKQWNHIVELLQVIEKGYFELFQPKPGEDESEQWIEKRRVALPAFMSYYNQGILNYDEQIIERVDTYFSKYTDQIEKRYGLSVQDLIEIYNWIDGIGNRFLQEKINPAIANKKGWEESIDDMTGRGLMPWEWQENLPQSEKNFFEFMSDKGSMFRFSQSDIATKFGDTKAKLFLDLFTCQRSETEFLYYTEQNPLHFAPIFKIDATLYQGFELNHLILAIYNVLTRFCLNEKTLKDKFIKHRGNMLEQKAETLLIDFSGADAKVHRSYYTDKDGEQDVLILKNGTALIIETKADKLDEPRREPEKAYPILLQNFKACIQKGYDQCYRVKEYFINKRTIPIFLDEGKRNKIIELRTTNYHSAFSIVVTLERFAHIQIDLTTALEIYDNDEFPWSVSIDELEMFLLVMKKEQKKFSDLVEYLKIRQQIQGRVACHDETQIFGFFIQGNFSREIINSDKTLKLPHNSSDIFDDYYQFKGLGLKNEKNMEIKTSGKYLPIGNMKIRNDKNRP